LERSVVAGGVMSGYLSWDSRGQCGAITVGSMSWPGQDGQQLDNALVYPNACHILIAYP
jgi:hypothetical protein